jgi:hypothetical protein
MTAAEGKGMTTLARRGQGDQTRRKERMRAGEVEGGRCKTQTNIEKESNSNNIYSKCNKYEYLCNCRKCCRV